jgi:hypothetical protein
VVLVDFLHTNADIFAWSPSDMPGISREVAEHSLDILPHSRAVQQRLQHFNEERCRAIGAELRKLLEAGFIKEVFHPTWLANPVLVKKKNGKWRMCVDYTSLNKACPKVPFPLPQIDQIVDSTAGCELLCFLDAYSGYDQIKMKESDQLAISFITPFVMFCYVTMPFGLQKAGATYQRCMQHVFGDHIGRTIEAVNTKNWYREETDMWAEFGRRAPFGKRFSSKHPVEASADGSTSSFDRRTVPRVKEESIRERVMTWIEYKERMN